MISNNEILSNNFKLVHTCCSYQLRKYSCPYEYLDDLVQTVSFIILRYDNVKLNRIYEQGHLNAFITGILRNQLYSTNSEFYRVYRKFSSLTDEIGAKEEQIIDE